ncbi:class I SAM-dependent methyltransferase [Paenibacillus pinihumi]|uniref:class I SAM-dependent methyltransferase n=1 Tax=Paenibacillus pinihumi TaxID=669462 RepID=UPI001FE0D656|nr:class I SAM-dependent methyltransferase [Paenibacillus pinihumi]
MTIWLMPKISMRSILGAEPVLSALRADFIFMAQVLLHIDDYEFVLSRLFDILGEGGHLLIADFNKMKMSYLILFITDSIRMSWPAR